MLDITFFYLLLLLPAAMALVASLLSWSSLAQPVLFGLTAFLSLSGLQSIAQWFIRSSLNNFVSTSPLKAGAMESPPIYFLLSYYGTEVLILVVLGSALLWWLAGALAKA